MQILFFIVGSVDRRFALVSGGEEGGLWLSHISVRERIFMQFAEGANQHYFPFLSRPNCEFSDHVIAVLAEYHPNRAVRVLVNLASDLRHLSRLPKALYRFKL